MSASGGGDVVHGAGAPTPRWWKPFRDVPLVVLAVLSLVAALVGWYTQASLDRAASQIAPVTPTATPDAVAQVCRPAVTPPGDEPWIDRRDESESVWKDHAAELGDPVVRGQDGWAFYNDQVEQNFSQAVGRRLLTASQVTAWHDYFRKLAGALAAQGIELSIQITPSASSVYPEKLPEWAAALRGSTPLDQLLAASPDLPIVDFRHDLREAAQHDAVFTPVNSHWTDWGGYVGWQTYARCHAVTYPGAAPIVVPPVDGVRTGGIYNEYASSGVPDAEPAWDAPRFSQQLAPVTVTDGSSATSTSEGGKAVDLSKLPASTETAGAWSTQKALILRDSMGNALSGLWAQQYAQTWQIQHRYDDWSNPPNYRSLVEQDHPDVVIVQLAERHLVNAPAVGVGPGY
ncbi:alginate O-acetyltransferase AlgX-related protein [Microbacterium dextranolyticum]|uniref:AlgX/AlgJ SGNH hydrolase-like domain-containing protein n=1 Tax=Microbacterium dextranolyticum TaxID=36806 RepID=A0A9W6HL85_9MICO|nr:hypothetical protein [Microbacterium dextranolyticum]MBM7463753.1 hypothetical protein [Microbacterium dextranolyticum]GLJ94834.1 hypothetical protein GCM10017591_08960 [Microbacterium dextranolyticum]